MTAVVDRYTCFAELAAKERLGIDYQIRVEDHGTQTVMVAPHGGLIEPGTSEIAEAIARDDLSICVFEGLRQRSRELHITSTNFDEPNCLELVASALKAIAIHGRKDGDDSMSVWLGGQDVALGDAIASRLGEAGFQVVSATGALAGADPTNICNRGSSKGGVQLELPRTLRDQLLVDPARLHSFANAVRKAISLEEKVDSR